MFLTLIIKEDASCADMYSSATATVDDGKKLVVKIKNNTGAMILMGLFIMHAA